MKKHKQTKERKGNMIDESIDKSVNVRKQRTKHMIKQKTNTCTVLLKKELTDTLSHLVGCHIPLVPTNHQCADH